MVDVIKLISNTLSPCNLPVAFEKYTGNSSNYIVFFIITSNIDDYSDDDDELQNTYIQVSYFTKDGSTMNTRMKEIRQLMKSNGFCYDMYNTDYESDTNFFHLALRFNYGELL